MKSFFTEIKDHLSLITGSIVILGFLKASVFFYSFNIDVKEYLTFSDLTIFLSTDLLLIVVSGIIYIVLLSYFFIPLNEIDKKREEEKKDENQETKKNFKPSNKFFFTFGFIFLVSIITILSLPRNITFKIYFLMMIFNLMIILLRIVAPPSDEDKELRYLPFISVFITILLHFSFADITKVKFGGYNGTIVQTNHKTYIASDSLLYVRKTSNYTFFYNKKLKYSEAIPNSDIIYTKIVRNKNFKAEILDCLKD